MKRPRTEEEIQKETIKKSADVKHQQPPEPERNKNPQTDDDGFIMVQNRRHRNARNSSAGPSNNNQNNQGQDMSKERDKDKGKQKQKQVLQSNSRVEYQKVNKNEPKITNNDKSLAPTVLVVPQKQVYQPVGCQGASTSGVQKEKESILGPGPQLQQMTTHPKQKPEKKKSTPRIVETSNRFQLLDEDDNEMIPEKECPNPKNTAPKNLEEGNNRWRRKQEQTLNSCYSDHIPGAQKGEVLHFIVDKKVPPKQTLLGWSLPLVRYFTQLCALHNFPQGMQAAAEIYGDVAIDEFEVGDDMQQDPKDDADVDSETDATATFMTKDSKAPNQALSSSKMDVDCSPATTATQVSGHLTPQSA
jgi:hypothetical protein